MTTHQHHPSPPDEPTETDLDPDTSPLKSERFARNLGLMVMFLFGIIVAMAVAFSYFLVVAIHSNRDGIRGLACFIVQGTPNTAAPVIHEYRLKYHCPAFDPARAKDFQPPSSPAPTVTDTRIVHQPGATTTSTVTVPSPIPGPTVTAPGSTRTVPGPVRTRTLTKTLPAPRPTFCVNRICVTLPPLTG